MAKRKPRRKYDYSERLLYRSLWTKRWIARRSYLVQWSFTVYSYWSWSRNLWTKTPDDYDLLTEDEANAVVYLKGRGVKIHRDIAHTEVKNG